MSAPVPKRWVRVTLGSGRVYTVHFYFVAGHGTKGWVPFKVQHHVWNRIVKTLWEKAEPTDEWTEEVAAAIRMAQTKL